MRLVKLHFGLLTAAFFVGGISASAQLPGAPPDPLARIREAAKGNVEACSATGETLCEQVAPKIVANAQGNSPLAENLRRLLEISEGNTIGSSADTVRVAGSPREATGVGETPAIAWALAA